jgi:amino acid adenylation domain-containing protein
MTQDLKSFSRVHGATLYTILLAAYQVLLYRYMGQEDILVGSPTAGRNLARWAGVVGYFVNPVVIRADLSGNPSFEAFLDRVHQTVLAAFAHQDYPFDLLVERLRPNRDPSRSPIFQTMFILQQLPSFSQPELAAFAVGEQGAWLNLGELILESLSLEQSIAQFDLTLRVVEGHGQLTAAFEYNTDLFDAPTIARMAGHFQILLQGIVAHPNRPLSDLPLLTDAERQQLLVAWNTTQVEVSPLCIHQLFELQVARTPDAVAIVCPARDAQQGEDQYLTYWELNRRANQLAHYLQGLGVGPEVAVGICVERSVEMLIGLYAVLKAGGAYVPLDPTYPASRLAFMMEDARLSVLLTQAKLAPQLPVANVEVVCLDLDGGAVAQQATEDPASEVTPQNLAYVIYTSGSTGRPKGVAIQHHNAAALIDWAQHAFDTGIFHGTLASTSICFDLSVFEIFVPLSCGGTVILIEAVLHLAALPVAEAVTLVNTVPSAMRELLRLEGMPASVRTVNLAGEPLPTQLVQQIYLQQTIEQVFDLYGPSEDTTYSTYALRSATGPATIGRPIANTQVYLLDVQLNPVPVGVPGELYIGGAGLARGYLHRPGLTAEKFIPNPFRATADGRRQTTAAKLSKFSGQPSAVGGRLYKTGDLARYLPDGSIEFLGRLDHQVKLRGFRIELGEIETVLAQHPAIREVAVLVQSMPRDPADIRLVAYVVFEYGQEVAFEGLRHFLGEKLPHYMLPSYFVMLETLPLTPNGKVDRRALSAWEPAQPELEHTFVAPRTPVEEMLAEIWTEVLGLEQVGIYDDFFELGGHSLLVTQVLARIRQVFQVELPVHSLFQYSTIADAANYIEAIQWTTQSSAGPADAAEVDREVGKL